MAQQVCTQFEPNTNTSSATICKWCGKEKFMHEQITMAQQTDHIGDTNKMVTAVEWLVNQVNSDCLNSAFIRPELVDQAKAIEKEHHGKTWDKALDAYEGRGHLYVRAWSDFDEYYNKTYNK